MCICSPGKYKFTWIWTTQVITEKLYETVKNFFSRQEMYGLVDEWLLSLEKHFQRASDRKTREEQILTENLLL